MVSRPMKGNTKFGIYPVCEAVWRRNVEAIVTALRQISEGTRIFNAIMGFERPYLMPGGFKNLQTIHRVPILRIQCQ